MRWRHGQAREQTRRSVLGLPTLAPVVNNLSKPATDDWRRNAAMALLQTMLANPDIRASLWERYLVDRSEARLAVDLTDSLIRELERVP
jgi:hypothetical protein